MAAAIAKQVGSRHVVVTDINPYRLELAKKMGATLTLDVRTETIEGAQKKLVPKHADLLEVANLITKVKCGK